MWVIGTARWRECCLEERREPGSEEKVSAASQLWRVIPGVVDENHLLQVVLRALHANCLNSCFIPVKRHMKHLTEILFTVGDCLSRWPSCQSMVVARQHGTGAVTESLYLIWKLEGGRERMNLRWGFETKPYPPSPHWWHTSSKEVTVPNLSPK